MKRSSLLQYTAISELGVKPVRVWAYDKKGKFVCRLEIQPVAPRSVTEHELSHSDPVVRYECTGRRWHQ
jgi:hypothetical protein